MAKPVKGADATKTTVKTAAQLRKEEEEKRLLEEAAKKAASKNIPVQSADDIRKEQQDVRKVAAASSSGSSASEEKAAQNAIVNRINGTSDNRYTPKGKTAADKAQSDVVNRINTGSSLTDRERFKAEQAEKYAPTGKAAEKYVSPQQTYPKKEGAKSTKAAPTEKVTYKDVQDNRHDQYWERHRLPTVGANLSGDWYEKYKRGEITEDEMRQQLAKQTKTVDEHGNMKYDDIFVINGVPVTVEDLLKQGYSEEVIQRLLAAVRGPSKAESFVSKMQDYLSENVGDVITESSNNLQQYESRLRNGTFASDAERNAYQQEYQEAKEQYYQLLLTADSDKYIDFAIKQAQQDITDIKQGWDLIYSHGDDQQRAKLASMNQEIHLLENRVVQLQKIKNARDTSELLNKLKNNGDEELMNDLNEARNAATTNRAVSAVTRTGYPTTDYVVQADILENKLRDKGYTSNDFALYSKYKQNELYDDMFGPYLKWMQDHSAASKAIALAVQVLSSPVRGVLRAMTGLASSAYGGELADPGKVYTDAVNQGTQIAVQNILKSHSDENGNPTKFGKALANVYQWTASAAESIFMMGTVGPATSVFMGFNAAAETYDDALERGLSQGQAVTLGVLGGVFEALFEYLSLEKIRLFNSTKIKGFAGWLVMWAKSAGVEGSEEGFTDLANLCADLLVSGGLSEYNAALAEGLTPAQFAEQKAKDILMSIAGGAFSGGLMGGASQIGQHWVGSAQTRETGAQIRQTGDVEALIEQGLNSKDEDIVKLSKKMSEQMKDGKVSNKDAGKLYNALQAADVASAVKEEAMKRGASERDAEAIAQGLADGMTGQMIQPASQAAMETELGKQLIEEFSDVADWAGEANVKYRTRMAVSGVVNNQMTAGIRVNERISRTVQEVRKAIEEWKTYSLVKNGFEGQLRGSKGESSVTVHGITGVTEDGKLELAVDYDAKTGTNATAVFDPNGGEGTVTVTDTYVAEMLTKLQEAITGTNADEYSGNKLTVEAANVALANYDPMVNKDAGAYIDFVNRAFRAGSTGLGFAEFNKTVNQDRAVSRAEALTLEQMRAAWRTGAAAYNPPAGITYIGSKGSISAENIATAEALNPELRKHNLSMLFVDKMSEDNGFYIRDTGVVVVSLDADFNTAFMAAWHEAYHMIKNALGEKAGREFVDATLALFAADQGEAAVQEAIQQKKTEYAKFGHELSEEKAREEVAAQYFATLKTIDSMQLREAFAGDRNLLQKLLDALKSVQRALYDGLKKLAGIDKTVYYATKATADTIDYVVQQVEEALEQTAGKRAEEQTKRGEAIRKEAWEGVVVEPNGDARMESKKVTDQQLLDFLNKQIENGEYITVYRSMQVIDGKLYAPMNATEDDPETGKRELGYASEIGKWEMATESPEKAQAYMDKHPGAKYAKFDLDGVDNKTGGVAYNPYMHASNLMLNDQLSASYRRNLVVVEARVPLSEANGTYWAEYAKDPTGWAQWKAGGVANQLKKFNPDLERKLFLSRYMLPMRVVPVAEVAQTYKDYLKGTGLSIPWNVVTAELRHELERIGVPISYDDITRNKAKGEYIRFADKFPAEAVKATSSTVMQQETGEVDIDGEKSSHMHSLKSFAACTGYDVKEVDGIYQVVDSNGRKVNNVTKDVVKRSPLGNIVRVAVNNGNITAKQAEQQYEMLADLLQQAAHYKDFNMPWEISGSLLFSAIKANSDAQYGRTIDFSTICKKTQSIINVMSKTMLDLGRGLTAKEVREIVYEEVGKAGEPTPCPVCYVFSRWMGIGGILQNIYDFQLKYNEASKEDVQRLIGDTEARLRAFADAASKSKQESYFDKDGNYKYGKIISDMKSKPDGKVKRAEAKLNAHYEAQETVRYAQEQLAKDLDAKTRKQYEDILKAAKKKVLSDKVLATTNATIENGRAELAPLEEYQFLKSTRFNSDGSYDESYKPVTGKNGQTAEQALASVLFDLNNAEGLATQYPALWRYRSTRGCNAGKAILPYSDMWTGEIIQGIAGDIGDIQRGENNPFLNGDTAQQQTLLDRAIRKQSAQNLIGGMRFQSTSDFRYEYGSDYLMAFLELQAIGANVQLYTKVIEAVDFFASMGADINLSLMPENDGFRIDENGNRVLAFSSVTGINWDGAKILIDKYDNVQAILVGISDEHITAAIGSREIGFVIPFHGSGNTVKVIADLMSLLRESLDITTAKDYSAVQNDRERTEKSYKGNKALYERHQRLRKLRMMILTGRDGGKNAVFTDEDLDMISENDYLSDLYRRFWTDKNADEYGVRLSKSQAEKIFPFEYWDKSLTLDQADENGRRFIEYCESLGYYPRFSGVTDGGGKNGSYGDFTDKHGYWKLLIDRPMYDNKGRYREQQTINATSMQTTYLSPAWGTDNYAEYMQKDSTKDTAKIEEISQRVEERIGEEETMHSKRVTAQQDADYMSAVERGDTDEAQRMVEEAARAAGYDSPMLYHGTTQFGFTKVNTRKSDDRISFFATDSEETARTYSYNAGGREIGRKNAGKGQKNASQEAVTRLADALDDLSETGYADTERLNEIVNLWKEDADAYTEKSFRSIFEADLKDVFNRYHYDEYGSYEEFAADRGGAFMQALDDAVASVQTHHETGGEDGEFGSYRLYAKEDGLLEIDAHGNIWSDVPLGEIAEAFNKWNKSSGETSTTRLIAEYAKKNGYTGVKFTNLVDNGGRGTKNINPSTVYAFFNPKSQVKSADAVTYDNRGDVIPLSERFNERKNDIRYSKKHETVQEKLERTVLENDELKEQLRETNKLLKDARKKLDKATFNAWIAGIETGGNVPVRNQLLDVVKKYNDAKLTGVSNDELTDRIIRNLVDLEQDDTAADMLTETLWGTMFDKAEGYTETIENETRDLIREHTKGQKFFVADDVFRNLVEMAGSRRALNSTYRRVYGMTLVPESEAKGSSTVAFGVAVNGILEEMPNVFAGSYYETQASEGDPFSAAAAMYEMQDAMEVQEASGEEVLGTETLFEVAMQEAADFAEDIIRLTPMRTVADEYAEKMAELRTAYQGRLQAKQKEIESLRGKVKRRDAAVERVRADRDEKLAAQRKYYIEQRHKNVEQRKETAFRNQKIDSIGRTLQWLRKRAESPSYGKYIPDELRGIVNSIFDRFFSEERNAKYDTTFFTSEEIMRMRTFYNKLNDEGKQDNEGDLLIGRYNENIATMLDDLLESMMPQNENGEVQPFRSKDKENRMTPAQIDAIDKILKHFKKIISEANTMFVEGKRVEILESGKRLVSDVEKNKLDGPMRGLREKMRTGKLQMGMLKPVYLFNEVIGGEMRKYFNDIRDAEYNWGFRISQASHDVQEIVKKYHYNKWQDEDHVFTLDNGNNIVLTKDAVMQIYATWQRERQAYGTMKETNHLLGGGIQLSEEYRKMQNAKRLTEEQKNNNVSKKQVQMAGAMAQPLTMNDLQSIIGTLTEEQIGYVNAMVHYLSTTCAEWGNEASREILGFDVFNDSYYFPFTVSDNYLTAKVGEQNSVLLKNISFTHAITRGANKPVIIAGFSQVAAKHIGSMASYSTLALPLDNMQRIRNYRDPDDKTITFNSVLNDVYGTDEVKKYITTFLKQMNGDSVRDHAETQFGKFLSYFKRNAVGLNLSVVFQQPSAIVRAMSMVDVKYFWRSTVPGHFLNYEELKKYSGVAIIKEMGGWDTDTGRSTTDYILGTKTFADKLSDVTGFAAEKADAITWSHIWEAVKRETADKMGIKYRRNGMSEEFYQAAAARFNEVIEYTQVYDSTLSRSQNMRSQSKWMQLLTAFMAEPTTTYNMLMFSGLKKNGKTINKGVAIAAFLLNTVFNSALQNLVGAWRDKEDEPYWERYLRLMMESIAGQSSGKREWLNNIPFANNILSSELFIPNMIPYIKEIISYLQGYDMKRNDLSVFTDIIDAIDKMDKAMENYDALEWQWDDYVDAVGPLITSLMAMTPLPLKSLYRDLWTANRQADKRLERLGFDTIEDLEEAVKQVMEQGTLKEKLNTFAELFGYADFWQHVIDNVKQTVFGEWDENEQLYYAVLNGDQTTLDRYTAITKEDYEKFMNSKTDEVQAKREAVVRKENSLHAKMANALMQVDERVRKAAEAEFLGDMESVDRLVAAMEADGFSLSDIYDAIDMQFKELYPVDKEYDTNETVHGRFKDYTELNTAFEYKQPSTVKKLRDAYIESGYKADTVDNHIGDLIDDKYANGMLDLDEAQRLYKEYTGISDAKVVNRLQKAAVKLYGNDDNVSYDQLAGIYRDIGVSEDDIGKNLGDAVVADYEDGKFGSKSEAVSEYMRLTGETDRETAGIKFDYADAKAKDDKFPLEFSQYNKYRANGLDDVGVDVNAYSEFLTATKGYNGSTTSPGWESYQARNARVKSTKKYTAMQYAYVTAIDETFSTPEQKDAVYKAIADTKGWSLAKLQYAPWH